MLNHRPGHRTISLKFKCLLIYRKGGQGAGSQGAVKMNIKVASILNMINYLEALNSSLKRKHVVQWQYSGHRLQTNILLYHFTIYILSQTYVRHYKLTGYIF